MLAHCGSYNNLVGVEGLPQHTGDLSPAFACFNGRQPHSVDRVERDSALFKYAVVPSEELLCERSIVDVTLCNGLKARELVERTKQLATCNR
jgi:hypothetical protein